jgi:hypothetical protein
MPFHRWHVALHEGVELRNGEGGFTVPLAPDHAFIDELLANRCHSGRFDAQR